MTNFLHNDKEWAKWDKFISKIKSEIENNNKALLKIPNIQNKDPKPLSEILNHAPTTSGMMWKIDDWYKIDDVTAKQINIIYKSIYP